MMLSSLILLLLIAGLVALISGYVSEQAPKWIAAISLLLAWIPISPLLNTSSLSTQQTWLIDETHTWFPRFNINFHLAADGLSLLLIILTLAAGLIAVLSAWKETRTKNGFFFLNILWTLAGVIGVFTALDLFLFFVFWEAMLIPMYFLIVIWGNENRRYAALKFFLFTQAGGLLMLVSILALVLLNYQNSGQLSFDYTQLLSHTISDQAAFWIMLGFLASFAIKLPVLPFHNWQPDAYSQAPTAASIILAAVLSKMGGFGIIRFVLPLFPHAVTEIAPYAMFLGSLTIVYGAFMAFSQQNLKRLIAYSSFSHMGFILLGCFALTAQAWQGAVMQMMAHGISTAALFALAGAIQYRYNTCDLNKLGGIWQTAPKLAAFGLFFIAASLGLPGLGNFVAEFLVLIGSFKHNALVTAIAATALIFGAVYSLRMAQKVFFGPLTLPKTFDFDTRETCMMLVMAVILIFMGLHPQPILDMAQQTLDHFPLPTITTDSATAGAQP